MTDVIGTPVTSGNAPDFAYYTITYLGNAIAEADFPRLALRASEKISMLTYQRAAAITDDPTIDLIKMATCAVAEAIQAVEADGGMDGITSEGIGSSRVTYAANSAASRKTKQKYSEAAGLYLAPTGLMYRGFAPGEYSSYADIRPNDILS
jgi:L-asparaginase/Glu-tRNA(Gln) amidotransferase subunit D